MTTPVTIQEPTQAELDHLVGVIGEKQFAGPLVIAQHLLAVGYRKVPEPEPVRYGECGTCTKPWPVNEAGALPEHDDRGLHCIGSRMMPRVRVDAPESGGTDG